MTVSENEKINGSFFDINGTHFINLTNSQNVFWLEIKDSSPDYYLIVETLDGQMIEKTFEMELEANGGNPNGTSKFLPNGFLNIEMKKELCRPFYNFLGFIRFSIFINETNIFKASVSLFR